MQHETLAMNSNGYPFCATVDSRIVNLASERLFKQQDTHESKIWDGYYLDVLHEPSIRHIRRVLRNRKVMEIVSSQIFLGGVPETLHVSWRRSPCAFPFQLLFHRFVSPGASPELVNGIRHPGRIVPLEVLVHVGVGSWRNEHVGGEEVGVLATIADPREGESGVNSPMHAYTSSKKDIHTSER